MELILRSNSTNIIQMERVASLIAGGTFAIFGLREALAKGRPLQGAALTLAGAALIRRGTLGAHRAATQASGNQTIPYQQGIRVDRSITINTSRETVYSFWRDLENLPRFMKYVQSVKKIDDTRSHWTVEGPAGQTVEWDAEVINEIPNELIAWRSLPGTSVNNTGSVRFEHATAGRGTKVSVTIQYDPPAGPVGALVAKLFGREPEQEIDLELHRLKSILEAGELPTSQGQPAGRPMERAVSGKHGARQAERVEDASEASFPASDPPAYTHNGL